MQRISWELVEKHLLKSFVSLDFFAFHLLYLDIDNHIGRGQEINCNLLIWRNYSIQFPLRWRHCLKDELFDFCAHMAVFKFDYPLKLSNITVSFRLIKSVRDYVLQNFFYTVKVFVLTYTYFVKAALTSINNVIFWFRCFHVFVWHI